MNGFDDFDTQIQCDELYNEQEEHQEDYYLDDYYEAQFDIGGDL
jgi:hypothetical protein